MKLKIIATDGGSRYVVQVDENSGYVVDTRRKEKSPIVTLQNLGRFGQWEDYDGDLTTKDLEDQIK